MNSLRAKKILLMALKSHPEETTTTTYTVNTDGTLSETDEYSNYDFESQNIPVLESNKTVPTNNGDTHNKTEVEYYQTNNMQKVAELIREVLSDTENGENEKIDYQQLQKEKTSDEEVLNLDFNDCDNEYLEDGDSPDSPDSHPDNKELSTNSEPEEDGEVTKTRKRKKNADKADWLVNKTKYKRMRGMRYEGYQRNKKKHITYGINRPERRMGDSCRSSVCQKSSKHFCNTFTEDERRLMFEAFWGNMDWGEKRAYITGNMEYTTTKRSSKGIKPSRRGGTYWYYLRNKNNEKKRVCKLMFLKTFGLNEDMVYGWFKKTEHGLNTTSKMRESTVKHEDNKEKRATLISWFESLPKMPSHYCRKDSSKLYLETIIQSKAQLYREYVTYCDTNNKAKVSSTIFDKTFCDMNLSLYKPKKDFCDTCASHEVGNIEEQDYAYHMDQKNFAREEKTKDKEEACHLKNYSFTMDLQAVKNCPLINASAIYYKKKLTVHNFTVYNLESHDGANYWWDETESDLSASTFTTLIVKHIEENCPDTNLPVILWSDGCCYQNRNAVLSNALLNLAIKRGQTIEQKYLVKGHTQMECDSVHHLIEVKLKNRKIYLPHDYIRVTEEARAKPQPYRAFLLNHTIFKNYAVREMVYKSIRPGTRVNDPTVTDLRALKYCPVEKKIFFKINFRHEYQPLPVRINPKGFEVTQYSRLHLNRLKIKIDKFNHLKDLKSFIPADCHAFYDNIPTE